MTKIIVASEKSQHEINKGSCLVCHVNTTALDQSQNGDCLGLLSPLQGNSDIAWNSSRKIDDLNAQSISKRTQAAIPELIDFFGDARKSLFPSNFLLVDSMSAVGA